MHEERYLKTSLECYEVMKIAFGKEALKNFMLLSAFKYLWRYQQKGGREDIAKARDYMETIKNENLIDDERDRMQAMTIMSVIISHECRE